MLSVSSSSVTLSVSPNPNASDSLDELEAAEWWASAVPKGVAERLAVADDARDEGRDEPDVEPEDDMSEKLLQKR